MCSLTKDAQIFTAFVGEFRDGKIAQNNLREISVMVEQLGIGWFHHQGVGRISANEAFGPFKALKKVKIHIASTRKLSQGSHAENVLSTTLERQDDGTWVAE